MDFKILGRITLQRYIELTASELFLSIIVNALDVFNKSGLPLILLFLTVLGIITFIVINIRLTRQCYFYLADCKVHCIVHTIAYILFGATSVLVYLLDADAFLYSWAYSLTDFLSFVGEGIDTWKSALVFHGVCFLSVIFAPFGMHWVKIGATPDYDDFEDENENADK